MPLRVLGFFILIIFAGVISAQPRSPAAAKARRIVEIKVVQAGEKAMVPYPNSFCIDKGTNLFVPVGYDYYVAKISAGGVLSSFAGLEGVDGHRDGLGQHARFGSMSGICMDDEGNLFVGDSGGRIAKISPAGMVTTFADVGLKDGQAFVTGLVLDGAGNLYATDHYWNRILKISREGKVGVVAQMTNDVWGLNCLCLDKMGNIYVPGFGRIFRVSQAGKVEVFVEEKPGPDGFREPRIGVVTGMCFDSEGNLLVASGSLAVVKPDKTIIYRKDILGDAVCLSSSGDLYLSESSENGRFWKVARGTWEAPLENTEPQKKKKRK